MGTITTGRVFTSAINFRRIADISFHPGVSSERMSGYGCLPVARFNSETARYPSSLNSGECRTALNPGTFMIRVVQIVVPARRFLASLQINRTCVFGTLARHRNLMQHQLAVLQIEIRLGNHDLLAGNAIDVGPMRNLDAMEAVDLHADDYQIGFNVARKLSIDQQVLIGSAARHAVVLHLGAKHAPQLVRVTVGVGDVIASGIRIAEHQNARIGAGRAIELVVGAKAQRIGHDKVAAIVAGNAGAKVGRVTMPHIGIVLNRHPVSGLGK